MHDTQAFLTQSYDFALDSSFIAKEPASPKDSAKLLVYNRTTNTITHTLFRNILDFIPVDTAILLNNTKVIKARIFGTKSTGGRVELLLNAPLPHNRFSVYIKGKVHIDTVLYFDQGLKAQVISLHESGTRDVEFSQNGTILDFDALQTVLDAIGHLPLPPYINRPDTQDDATNYQTVFAQHAGAVAAPTASLHFTDELFEKTCARHKHAFLTLHVGAGTFKPIVSDDIRAHTMHSEYYSISPKALELIQSEHNILAVGTTVTRTIEYYVRTQQPQGQADLFLHPNNTPQRVNHLLTNFHLPKSTLIMLVASFIGRAKTLEIYEEAKRKNYRFFSYGDAMLII